MQEALSRVEAGEDPEQVEAEMGDALENDELFLTAGKKGNKRSGGQLPPKQVNSVFMVGSGLMGSGIAQVCAQAGMQVCINGQIRRQPEKLAGKAAAHMSCAVAISISWRVSLLAGTSSPWISLAIAGPTGNLSIADQSGCASSGSRPGAPPFPPPWPVLIPAHATTSRLPKPDPDSGGSRL